MAPPHINGSNEIDYGKGFNKIVIWTEFFSDENLANFSDDKQTKKLELIDDGAIL